MKSQRPLYHFPLLGTVFFSPLIALRNFFIIIIYCQQSEYDVSWCYFVYVYLFLVCEFLGSMFKFKIRFWKFLAIVPSNILVPQPVSYPFMGLQLHIYETVRYCLRDHWVSVHFLIFFFFLLGFSLYCFWFWTSLFFFLILLYLIFC